MSFIGVLRLIKGEWLEWLVNYHYLVNLFQISINTMERGSGALEHKEGCNPISTSLRCIDFGFQIKCSWQSNQKAVDRVYTSRSRNCCFQWGKRHNFVLGESLLYIFERKLQLDCEQGAESAAVSDGARRPGPATMVKSENLAKNGRKYLAGWLEWYSFQHFNLQESTWPQTKKWDFVTQRTQWLSECLPIIFGTTLLSIDKAVGKGSRSDILVLGYTHLRPLW